MTKKRKAETPIPKEVIEEQESSSSDSEEEEDDVEEEEEEESSEETSSEDESSSDSSDEEDDDENADDESTKRDKLKKLLEPFGKDQIIGILKDAALNDPNVLSRITQQADSDPTHRKIFVHGLSWDATPEQFQQAFQPFGEIEDCKLITDKNTGRGKGYGFVTYKTRSAAKKALKNPQRKIGGRTVSFQLAALGNPGAGSATDSGNRKLFVANVGRNISPEKLRAFFGTFGEIEEGPMGLDPVTNKPRGFAIFVFKSEDGVRKALLEPVKLFEGSQLNCKKFVEGQNSGNKNSNLNNIQQQGDVGYNLSVNAGMLAPNLNAGGVLVSQNPGFGLVGNPMLAGFGGSGLSPSPVMGGMAAGSYGINSVSPSVIGSYGYGLQAALQGLGAYQNSQLGQSSSAGTRAGVVAAASAAATARVGAKKSPSVSVSTGISHPSFSGY